MQPSPKNFSSTWHSGPFVHWQWNVFLLVALVVVTYLPAVRGGYIWDDDVLLTNNPHMESVQGLIDLWIRPKTVDYFPLTLSALWFMWQIWGAEVPAAYHWACILLHAFNAVLVWALLQRLKIPGAWLAGALFAVHPVTVESVAWIAEIKNTFSMPFFLASLWFWVVFEERQGRGRWQAYVLSLVFFILALLCKVSVVPLPAVLLLYAWWRHRWITVQNFLHTLPFFAVGAVLACVTIVFQNERAIGGEAIPIGGVASRVAGAGMAVWFYLYKAVLPINLMVVYPRWQLDPPSWWMFIPGAGMAALLLACALSRAKSWPQHLLLALGFFVLMLSPVLGLMKMSYMRHTLVADHFQYLALMAITALAAAILTIWTQKMKPSVNKIIHGGTWLAIASMAISSNLYAAKFANQQTLWTDAIKRNPDAWVGHAVLGAIEIDAGDVVAAEQHLITAKRLAPFVPAVRHNLALVYNRQGRTDEMLAEIDKAIELDPQNAHHLGAWIEHRLASGKMSWAESVSAFESYLKLDPENGLMHSKLSRALLAAGEEEKALSVAEKGVALAASDKETLSALGKALIAVRQTEQGISRLRQALEIDPNHLPSLSTLSWTLAVDKNFVRPEESITLAERAVSLTGRSDPALLDTLAAAYAADGKFEQAVQTQTEAIEAVKAANLPELEKEWQARLHLYQERQAYLEESPKD